MAVPLIGLFFFFFFLWGGGGIKEKNVSLDSYLITTFTDIDLIEIEGSKPLLENREFEIEFRL